MNTSLKWIKDLVPGLDCTPQEYMDAMTLSGSKVEGYENMDEDLDKIVIGQVKSIEKHPDADKLVICQVQIDEEGNEVKQFKTNDERRKIANKYLSGIKNPEIILPYIPNDMIPVWHIFAIRCKRRKELETFLNNKGIGTNKHYPIPMHLQKCYRDLGFQKGDFPIAEEISATELSIPMYYGMTEEEIQYVIDAINEFE